LNKLYPTQWKLFRPLLTGRIILCGIRNLFRISYSTQEASIFFFQFVTSKFIGQRLPCSNQSNSSTG